MEASARLEATLPMRPPWQLCASMIYRKNRQPVGVSTKIARSMTRKKLEYHRHNKKRKHKCAYSGDVENVLKATIHALSEERHNGVGSVA